MILDATGDLGVRNQLQLYGERTKKFYRCELFDHGEWAVEAQILDRIDPTIARLFHPIWIRRRRARSDRLGD